MINKAWNSIEEVPYWFSKIFRQISSYTGQEIADIDPNSAFPDCK